MRTRNLGKTGYVGRAMARRRKDAFLATKTKERDRDASLQPRWSRDGREIFYRSTGDRPKIMAVAVETRGGLHLGLPKPLPVGGHQELCQFCVRPSCVHLRVADSFSVDADVNKCVESADDDSAPHPGTAPAWRSPPSLARLPRASRVRPSFRGTTLR